MFFLCYFLTCNKNSLEIFSYGAPLLPTGKLGKLNPPPPSDPFRGVHMDIFWNHTLQLRAVIFTRCQKRGNYGPFCSPNAFYSDFDNSTRQKMCCLETWLSPLVQKDHLKLKLCLCCFFVMKWERWPPFFICVCLLVMATQKYIYINGNVRVDSGINMEFLYLEPQRSGRQC